MQKNIAIAGIGVVGKEVLEYINSKQDFITQICNHNKPQISAISSRKTRNYPNIKWTNNPLELINQETDILVELIGGEDGIAYDLVKQALNNKIPVVTANKALIAKHGNELLELANQNNVTLNFEAAIAGAIPIVKTLKTSLAINKISEIFGILNGTCNFILTLMEEENNSFEEALQIASDKGYAEADPTLDIEGIDAAHKIALLSALAFKIEIDFEQTEIQGITKITLDDFKLAKSLGYKIKLLGRTLIKDNKICQYVRPFFVPLNHQLASVSHSLNSIYIESNLAKETVLTGRGAGGEETASSVLADICDCLRDERKSLTNLKNSSFKYDKSVKLKQKFIYNGEKELEGINILEKKDNYLIFEIENYQKANKLVQENQGNIYEIL